MAYSPLFCPRFFLAFLCALIAFPTSVVAQAPPELETLVQRALNRGNAVQNEAVTIQELEAKVQELRSIFLPKIKSLMFIAPMYSVQGSALQNNATIRYQNVRDWGPYTHIEANLVQPIYTFGRAESGKKAAEAQLKVGKAKLTAVRNSVRHDVTALYYSLLYARSLEHPLSQADDWLQEAIQLAENAYSKADGSVTQSDLQQLKYGQSRLEILRLQRRSGEQDAMDGLRAALNVGLVQDLEIEATRFKRPSFAITNTTLSQWLVQASTNRPEWKQLREGREAAIAFHDAQRLSSAPVLFLGANITHDWSPTREDAANPYHFDPYNNLVGGIALGLQFDVDLGKDKASRSLGQAAIKRVEVLKEFAESGIPIQVARAHRALQEAFQQYTIAKTAKKSAQKWLTFAMSAYRMGTGESRSLFESLVAFLETRQMYYSASLQWYLAVNQLYLATGDLKVTENF
jgi:outer membrane protein TolC